MTEVLREEERVENYVSDEDASQIEFWSTMEILGSENLALEEVNEEENMMEESEDFDITEVNNVENWNKNKIKSLLEEKYKKYNDWLRWRSYWEELWLSSKDVITMVHNKVVRSFNQICKYVSGTTLANVHKRQLEKFKEKEWKGKWSIENAVKWWHYVPWSHKERLGKISSRIDNFENEAVEIINNLIKQTKESRELVQLEKNDEKDYFKIEWWKRKLTSNVNDKNAWKILWWVVNKWEMWEIDFSKCTNEKIRNKYGNGVHKFEKNSKWELVILDWPSKWDKIQIWEWVEITPPSQIKKRAEDKSRADAYHKEKEWLSDEKKRELYNNLPKKLKWELNTEALRNEFFNVTEKVLDKAIKTWKENRRELWNEPVSKVLYTKKNNFIEIHYIDENWKKQSKNYWEDSISDKLFNIIDGNETDLVAYMTWRIQIKWEDYSRRTKHNEVLNNNNKWEKIDEWKKSQIVNWLRLLEPYLDNMWAKEINIYIEDVIYSIANKENFNTWDVEQICRELGDKIWNTYWGRVSHKTNAWNAYYYGEEQYDSSIEYEKRVRNVINNIVNWNTGEQEKWIRTLWEIFGWIRWASETSYIWEWIVNRDLENIEINDKKYDEYFKKINESFWISEWVDIEKQKKNIDELYDIAKKWYPEMLTFLVWNGYLPPEAINNDDKKLQTRIQGLIKNLNDMDKYVNDFNMTEEDLVQNRSNIKTEIEKKWNLNDDEKALLLDVTEKLNNNNPIYREILLEITIEQTKQSMRYWWIENMLKVNLLDYLAEKWGWIKWIENSDIYNDIKWYGWWIMNWSDEFRERFWMNAENIVIEVLIIAISWWIAWAAAGAVVWLWSKVATNVPRLRKIYTVIKNMWKIWDVWIQVVKWVTKIWIEWAMFHMTNTMLTNIISWENLWNIWEWTENAQWYAESIAFFGVLKIFGWIIWAWWKVLSESEIWRIMKKTMWKNELSKFSKWLWWVAVEMWLIWWTGAAVSLMFWEKVEWITCESLIHLFWIVIWLRVTKWVEKIVIKEIKKWKSKKWEDNEYKVEYKYSNGQKKEVRINGKWEEKNSNEKEDKENKAKKWENDNNNGWDSYFEWRSHKFDVTETQAKENSIYMDDIIESMNETNRSEKLAELKERIKKQSKKSTWQEIELTDEQLLSILDAHEQDWILWELTTWQLKQKVKILSETITDKNIRRFLLEAGFCGKLFDKIKANLTKNLDYSESWQYMEKNVDRIIPQSYFTDLDFVFRTWKTEFLIEQTWNWNYRVINLTDYQTYELWSWSESIIWREWNIRIQSDNYASRQHLSLKIDFDWNIIIRDTSSNGTLYFFTDKQLWTKYVQESKNQSQGIITENVNQQVVKTKISTRDITNNDLSILDSLNKWNEEEIYLNEYWLPKNVIWLWNWNELYVTNCLKYWGRTHIVWYVNEWWKMKLRLFYRSNSEWARRACPWKITGRKSNWKIATGYSKWERIKNSSYETTTKVAPEIQNIFDALPQETSKSNPITLEWMDPNLQKKIWDVILEKEMADNIKITKLFEEYPDHTVKAVMDHNSQDVKRMYENLWQEFDLSEMEIVEWKWYTYEHPFLWNIDVTVCSVNINWVDLYFSFARAMNDPQNRVRIEEVRYADAELTSFWIYNKQINAAPLTWKPIDYDHQVPKDMRNNEKIGWTYIDIRTLYQGNPFILKFKDISGIKNSSEQSTNWYEIWEEVNIPRTDGRVTKATITAYNPQTWEYRVEWVENGEKYYKNLEKWDLDRVNNKGNGEVSALDYDERDTPKEQYRERSDWRVNTERKERSEVQRNTDVIAIWDLHGEYNALKWNLEFTWLAKEVNWHLEWTGGNKIVVFQWDILADRWTDWLRIIEEIHQLREQARKEWWDIEIIVWNHDDFMISFLTQRGWANWNWIEVANHPKAPTQWLWLTELAKFIGWRTWDFNAIRWQQDIILEEMRWSPEWRLILEEICNMKLVSQIDDVLYCHTNPTKAMMKYLTKWNVQDNINYVNNVFQWYLRSFLLQKWEPPISKKEFNKISDLFLDTGNRDIWDVEKYSEKLKNAGINVICHWHSWWGWSWNWWEKIYSNNRVDAWVEIIDTDLSYWREWDTSWPHSVCVIKKDWWQALVWEEAKPTDN